MLTRKSSIEMLHATTEYEVIYYLYFVNLLLGVFLLLFRLIWINMLNHKYPPFSHWIFLFSNYTPILYSLTYGVFASLEGILGKVLFNVVIEYGFSIDKLGFCYSIFIIGYPITF